MVLNYWNRTFCFWWPELCGCSRKLDNLFKSQLNLRAGRNTQAYPPARFIFAQSTYQTGGEGADSFAQKVSKLLGLLAIAATTQCEGTPQSQVKKGREDKGTAFARFEGFALMIQLDKKIAIETEKINYFDGICYITSLKWRMWFLQLIREARGVNVK